MATASGGLTRTTTALGAIVSALGAVVVLAWVMRWERVLRVHPALPVMQFNAAILFVAAGAALIAGAREARRAQAILGGLVLLLAIPTFLQFPLNRSLGVDTLLWVPYTGSEGFALGRMAPSTAAALLLAGLAFVAGPSARLRSPVAGGAAAAILALSGFALVEYLFGWRGGSAWSRYARMAVHTAAAVGTIGLGLWCLAWRDGARPTRHPAWLPWTGASAALVLTGLLATTLTTVFPVEAWPLVLATAVALGLGVAVLVYAALAMMRVAGERADQIEAASHALALSDVRHRAVFEQSSAGIIELGIGGELLRANHGFCAMVGRTADQLTGLRLSDITHPDDLEQDTRHFDEALRDALPREGWIKRYLRPDGSAVWAHVSGSLVRAPDGTPLYLVGVIHDVTSQVRAEERLRESETRFRSVAEMAAAGIVMADADSIIVFANRAATAMFGYADGALVAQPLTALMPESYRPRHTAGVERFLTTGQSRVFGQAVTLEGLRRDGTVFPLDLSISTWEVRGERYFTGIIRDVTERVAAQRALDRTRTRLLAFVEHTPGAVAMFDRDLRYVAVSRRWIEDYQLGERDVIGLHHYDVFPEIRQMPEWHGIHRRCLAGAVERSDDDHFVRADGRDEWLRWEVRPWTDEHDAIGGIIMLTEVITPRKLAERALRESEQRLRLALENASHGLWDWNVETGALLLDERWWAIMGYQPGEQVGTLDTWQATVEPDDLPRLLAALERSLASDAVPYDVDYRARRKDGRRAWINTRGRVQTRDADGRPLRMMGTIHDVTARKDAEEQIRASLEEKEVLLREIHHRVKNNLAVISSLFYLESTTTDHPEALRVLAESRARIQSMALVHEFLYRSDRLSAVDFAEYATQLARQLLGSMQVGDRAAGLELETSPVSLPIDTAIPLGLILNEVLTNSLKHAFPPDRMPARPAIRLELQLGADGLCTLGVSDNGIGIAGLDPHQGRTLGLRLMRSLAQQIGAVIHFDALSPGTRVRLTFTP
jgi:PAS domain S-box-containing protein